MKQKVLLFFANLLAKMKQPLLPHINVYRPVHVSLVFPYKFLSKLVTVDLLMTIIYCVEELSVSVSNTLFSNFSLA